MHPIHYRLLKLMSSQKKYDAFISHSSNDKPGFVRPIANYLNNHGAKIWYDEFTLKPGQSLSRTIEKGISESQYGLIVLSKSFFEKPWGEYELKSFNSIELNNPGVIIPLWFNVNIEDVRNFSPYLADKLAIVNEKSKSINDISLEILKTIREDLFENVMQKKVLLEKKESGTPVESYKELQNVKTGPKIHNILPEELTSRIRPIRNSIYDVLPKTYEYWEEGFKHDHNPELEIEIWENIISNYFKSQRKLNIKTKDRKTELLTYMIYISMFEIEKAPTPPWINNIIKTKILKAIVNE